MESNSRKHDLEMKKIAIEELRHISGGELTDEGKREWWEKIWRLKMFFTLEDCLAYLPDQEIKDYVSSVWDQVPPLVDVPVFDD